MLWSFGFASYTLRIVQPYYRAMKSRIPYSRDPVINFQHRSTDFTLSIFGEDYVRIGKLVSKVPYAETGGNLFGLWTNQGNAVVLVATGPGKNCKRTSASFYQDIPYMQRVGDLLNGKYPLCHIGEWHSHHQMQLYKPSYGDCNTVQRNYPTGSQGFVLMIANILRDGTVKLSPYKFTDQRSPYKIGEIEVMRVENPFMKVGLITSAIENGKEERITQQQLPGVTIRECQGIGDPSYTGFESSDLNKRAKRGDYSSQRSHTRSRSRSPIKKNDRLSPPDEEKSETRKPRKQQETATFETTALGHKSYHKPQQSRFSSNKPSGQENSPARELASQWYDTQTDTLKRTMQFVTSLADDPTTESITRDATTLNITIAFTHHNLKWAIEFPSDFPRGSAKLKNQYGTHCYSVRGLGNIDSFEEALESTLQVQCTTCKHRVSYKAASGSRRERPNGHQRREMPAGQWHEIHPNTLKSTIDFVASLAERDGEETPKISRDKSTKNITMEFKHHGHEWEVEFPPSFPTGDVKLKSKVKGTTHPSNRLYAYSPYTNATLSSCNVKACGDLNMFLKQLESALREYCVKCQNYRRQAQNNRYARDTYQ